MTADEVELLQRVESLSNDTPGSAKDIADFLLREGGGMERMSMAQIARTTYCSKTTLVRFAKLLGFGGWTDFRRAFLPIARALDERHAQQAGIDVNWPVREGDAPEDAVRQIAKLKSLALNEAQSHLDPAQLSAAAHAVVSARRLCFFGSPPNWHYGGAFAYHLDQLGVECEVPHEEYCATAARRLQKGDCAVFCSYSGDLNRFPIGIAPVIKERRTTIVAITNSQSPLAELADCALVYPPFERYYEKIAGFYSCECTSYMLDALLATVFLACDPERKDKDTMLRAYGGLVAIPPYAMTI